MTSEIKAAFLDRDGTLIRDAEYLADPDGVVFLPGVFEALELLRNAGFLLVVVTNQSGIGRGLYSVAQYDAVAARIQQGLAEHGITLDAVYYCPHHPDFTGACDCRKPLAGMYRQAARNLGINFAHSVYVGDRLRDVAPALELGGRAFLLRSAPADELARKPASVELADDLLDAARRVTEKRRSAS